MADDTKQNSEKKWDRGTRGRFVSKKEKIHVDAPPEQAIVTFYGKSIRKFITEDGIYFVIADVMTVAEPIDLNTSEVTFTENFDEVKSKVSRVINELEVADADGILTLIKEVVGTFPGPFSRWIKE